MSAPVRRMRSIDALEALRQVRRDDEIVITTMAASRDWMELASGGGSNPLDLVFVPSAMGHATSIGLGLALARADRRVVVCNGDGSMLMNLGSLISITAAAPANLVVMVLDNGVYEVTGSQPTPASAAGRVGGERVEFAAIARACGFRTIFRFNSVEHWRAEVRKVLDAAGPTFVAIDVEQVEGARGPRSPGPASERAREFREALRVREVRPAFTLRRATEDDVRQIEELIERYVPSGALLPRTPSFIEENVADYVLALEGGRIVGCAHLDYYAPSLAELRSLAVDPTRKGVGIGRALAREIEALARKRHFRTLFAVSDDEAFFARLGFERRQIPELDKDRSSVSRYKGVYAKDLGDPDSGAVPPS